MSRPRFSRTVAYVAIVTCLIVAVGTGAEIDREGDDLVIKEFEVGRNGEPLIVKVTLEGHDVPVSMIVDSGCTVTIYDERLQPILGQSVGSRRIALARGEEKVINEFSHPRAYLDGMPLPRNGTVVAMDLISTQASDPRYDGCLGMDFLKQQIVEIDFDEGRLRLLRAVPADAGEKIEIQFNSHRIPTVEIKVGSLVKERFELDTGCIAQNIISQDSFNWLKALDELSRVQPICSDGVHLWSGERGRVTRTSLGSFVHRSLHFDTGTHNALGLWYLSRFKVVLDFPGSAIYLKRGKRFGEPDRDDMSGMWIIKRNGRGCVTRLGKGSPADRAGVKINDIIMSISGRDAEGLSIVQMRRLLEEEGKSVVLAVRREGRDIEVRFTLQDYFDDLVSQPQPAKRDWIASDTNRDRTRPRTSNKSSFPHVSI